MPLLEVRNISKSFGGLRAIKDVSFKVEKGELIGIIGPNGAGKSTLFNLISGVYHPDTGSIFFKGEDITKMEPYELVRKGLVRSWQIVRPFRNLTVEENIQVAFYGGGFIEGGSEYKQRLEEILQMTGLLTYRKQLSKNLPQGYLKRLEVARAVATGAELLMLDEPFAGLRADEIKGLMHLIATLHNRGLTLLIIEHVVRSLLELTRRVLVLHEGRLIKEGTPEEVRRDKMVIEAYFGEESEVA
ncbi:MAG: ABC transporter ATP-binding protein [Nitrososphaerales archaeon]